jgi:hypothetical protein
MPSFLNNLMSTLRMSSAAFTATPRRSILQGKGCTQPPTVSRAGSTRQAHACTSIDGVTPAYVKFGDKQCVQYWESNATRPPTSGASGDGVAALQALAQRELPKCLRQPFKSADEIRAPMTGMQYLLVFGRRWSRAFSGP